MEEEARHDARTASCTYVGLESSVAERARRSERPRPIAAVAGYSLLEDQLCAFDRVAHAFECRFRADPATHSGMMPPPCSEIIPPPHSEMMPPP